MRFRTTDLRPHGWEPGQTLQIPDWCVLNRVHPGSSRSGLVGHGADLGPRPDTEPVAAVGARSAVLGEGSVSTLPLRLPWTRLLP
jgi:hypothetical protein